MKQVWDKEELKGVPLKRLFGPGRYWRITLGERGWLRQAAASLLLFSLFVGVFLWEHPTAKGLQAGLRYWLANPHSDWTPALKEALETGLWLDSYDRQVFRVSSPQQLPVVRSLPPMTIPASGRFTREFGLEGSADGQQRLHAGIDITTEPLAPVRAALSGRVVKISQDQSLGRVVDIQHSGGLSTRYANLAEILVSEGQEVKQDTLVAKVGSAGTDQKLGRLHFEVRLDGVPVNPLDYFSPAPNKL